MYDEKLTVGFTELRASLDEACLGEEVTLTCATSGNYIRWQFTLSDRRFSRISRLFLASDSVGRSHDINTNELQLHLELTANSNGILNSTLLIYTTAALDRAGIECEGIVTRYYTFRIARKLLL